MSDNTKIEWTEATWNPITGCSVVSSGCRHCYAMKLAGTRLQHHPSREGLTVDTGKGPVWNGEVRFNEQWLDQPLRWKRPRKIFVCAHSDLFHPAIPDEWIDRVFAVMALSPQHTFQVLTKRPDRMRAYLSDRNGMGNSNICEAVGLIPSSLGNRKGALSMPLPNVWLGVSVEDQKAAEERIPLLLEAPAAVRWISAEPLLGGLSLDCIAGTNASGSGVGTYNALRGTWTPSIGNTDEESVNKIDLNVRIDWVVVGGESGPDARPMHPNWVCSLRDQCADASVPFLFKQWGEWAGHYYPYPGVVHIEYDGSILNDGPTPTSWSMMKVGKKKAGRLLVGDLHDDYPKLP
jgi:protein gp37